MRNLLAVLTGKRAVITLISTLLVLDVMLISCFFSKTVQNYIIKSPIFEILTLTVLAEILIFLSSALWRSTPMAYGTEEEVREKVRSLLYEDNAIIGIKVLSAGLRSRADFLRHLLELPRGLRVDVIACFGSANPDDLDREKFGPTHFDVLTHRLKEDEKSRLNVYQSFNRPSFRCVLLLDSTGPRYGFVGWYTYYHKDTRLTGRRNIQILLDRSTETGVALLRFAEEMFKKYSSDDEASVIFPPLESSS